MISQQSIVNVIQSRYSCRSFNNSLIGEEIKGELNTFMANHNTGPFGTFSRFKIGVIESGGAILKRLNTYGFIKGADEYLVGAMPQNISHLELEEFGCVLENIILKATSLGLGTCWMGGTYRKSVFSKMIDLQKHETLPAVIAIGNPANKRGFTDTLIRRIAKADHRKPWKKLFFENNFQTPLLNAGSEAMNTALEMVRLAPSASNKQPWRIVKIDDVFHFYLCRTPGYKEQAFLEKTNRADLQRLDIGIAMSHLENTLLEENQRGKWDVVNPKIEVPNDGYEYKVSWVQN